MDGEIVGEGGVVGETVGSGLALEVGDTKGVGEVDGETSICLVPASSLAGDTNLGREAF